MSSASFERVLITGARGFVGSYVVSAIKETFPKAVTFAVTRDAQPDTVQADIEDRDAIHDMVRRLQPDLVIHLAAQSTVTASPRATWKVNAGGAIILAEAIADHVPTATVLNVSSSEVYGDSFLLGRVTEDAATNPISVYGRTKIAAEAIFSDMLSPSNRLIHVRPFNHTGPGQEERFVVPSFAAQIVRIERGLTPAVIQVGNLESRRDFLDVRDVAKAYISLLQHAESMPMRSVFNICSGQCRRISDILHALLGLAQVPITIEQDPARLRASDIPFAEGDYGKLNKVTGWTPQIVFENTLADILAEFRSRMS